MTGVDTERYMDAAAGLIDLPLAPEWRPGVAGFLDLAAEMAAVLETVPLDDAHLELASVYVLPDLDEPPTPHGEDSVAR